MVIDPGGQEAGSPPAPIEPGISPGAVRGLTSALGDYASVTGARLGSVLLSLASILLTTRILAPADYAALAYVSVVATLVFAGSAWTATAVSRYGREELELGRTMRSVTWSRAALVLPPLAAATALLLGLELLGALPVEFSRTLAGLALLTALALVVGEHVSSLLEAAGRMRLSAVGWVVRHAAVVATLLVIYVTGAGDSVAVIAAATVIASTLVAVALASRVWRAGFWPPAWDPALLRRITLFSLPLVAFTVSQYVMASVDLIVIRAFASARDAGVYAVAYQGYSVLQQLAGASIVVLVPLLVSLRMANREASIRRYLERVVLQLVFLAAVVVGMAAPLVPIIVSLVFPDAFEAAAEPLTVLMGALVLFFGASLLAPILVLHESTRAIGLATTAAALTNVVGDIVLVGAFGLELLGAALATTTALAIICGSYFVIARRLAGSGAKAQPFVLTPLLPGILATLLLPTGWALAAGILGTLAAALLVLRIWKPFEAADADLIEHLDLPLPLKRLALRGLAVVAR